MNEQAMTASTALWIAVASLAVAIISVTVMVVFGIVANRKAKQAAAAASASAASAGESLVEQRRSNRIAEKGVSVAASSQEIALQSLALARETQKIRYRVKVWPVLWKRGEHSTRRSVKSLELADQIEMRVWVFALGDRKILLDKIQFRFWDDERKEHCVPGLTGPHEPTSEAPYTLTINTPAFEFDSPTHAPHVVVQLSHGAEVVIGGPNMEACLREGTRDVYDYADDPSDRGTWGSPI